MVFSKNTEEAVMRVLPQVECRNIKPSSFIIRKLYEYNISALNGIYWYAPKWYVVSPATHSRKCINSIGLFFKDEDGVYSHMIDIQLLVNILDASSEYVLKLPINLIGAYPPSIYNEYMKEWDKIKSDRNFAILNIKNDDDIIREISLEILQGNHYE